MNVLQTCVDFLLESPLYSSLPVFFLYCLSVSYKLRKTGSWSREDTHRFPLASAFSIVVCNMGGHLLIAAGLKGEGWRAVLGNDVRVGIVLVCWYHKSEEYW
jgi:hypothetical protein